MSEASDRALKEAEEAAARWETYVGDHFIEHVQLEAMRQFGGELLRMRGEMQAIRILLSEQAAKN